jgi:hypothetical protein
MIIDKRLLWGDLNIQKRGECVKDILPPDPGMVEGLRGKKPPMISPFGGKRIAELCGKRNRDLKK